MVHGVDPDGPWPSSTHGAPATTNPVPVCPERHAFRGHGVRLNTPACPAASHGFQVGAHAPGARRLPRPRPALWRSETRRGQPTGLDRTGHPCARRPGWRSPTCRLVSRSLAVPWPCADAEMRVIAPERVASFLDEPYQPDLLDARTPQSGAHCPRRPVPPPPRRGPGGSSPQTNPLARLARLRGQHRPTACPPSRYPPSPGGRASTGQLPGLSAAPAPVGPIGAMSACRRVHPAPPDPGCRQSRPTRRDAAGPGRPGCRCGSSRRW